MTQGEMTTGIEFGSLTCDGCKGLVTVTIDSVLRMALTCMACGWNRVAEVGVPAMKALLESVGGMAQPDPCDVEGCECALAVKA